MGIIQIVVLAAVLLPIVALAVAAIAHLRIGGMDDRLARLEKSLRLLEAAAAAPPKTAEAASGVPTFRAEEIAPPAPQPSAEPHASPAGLAAMTADAAAPAARFASDLEERVGGRLAVWLGAATLVLAGGFLVKYSLDRNLLGPAVRVAIGLVAGLLMLGGAEWLRPRASRPAEGLTAAGIGVLFAALFAATRLYDLLHPAAGFLLLSLVTAAGVSLSLRQGQLVGFVGLVGGFITPALVGSESAHPAGLFLYLLLLQVGIAAITRHRGWPVMLAAGALGGLGWAVLWLALMFRAEETLWLGLYLLLAALLYVTATGLPGWHRSRLMSVRHWPIAAVAFGAALLVQAAAVLRDDFAAGDWIVLLLLALGSGAVDRLDRRYRWFGWLGAAVALASLAAWRPAMGDEADRFAFVALATGALFGGSAYAAAWRHGQAGRFASLSVLATAASLLIAWYRLAEPGLVAWGVMALVLAALYLAGLIALQRAEPAWRDLAAVNAAVSAFAVGVSGFVALAIPFELDRAWIATAWACETAAIAWIERRMQPPDVRLPVADLPPLPPLRCVAAVLGVASLLKILHVTIFHLGDFTTGTVLWLWLLYGHGLPIAAFTAAALWLLMRRDDPIQRGLEWATIGFVTYAVWLAVAVLFRGTGIFVAEPGLTEAGTECVATLALGLGLQALGTYLPRRAVVLGAEAVAAAGLGATLLWPVLLYNPLWRPAEVGSTPIFNGLLWIYGAPAALAGMFAWRLLHAGRHVLAAYILAGSLALGFLLLLLEVRHWFHPAAMDRGAAGNGEQLSYSIVCLLFGAALMIPGVMQRQKALRYAALGMITLAVCKVFLFDASILEGLYRVGSFFGLGISLIGLGIVYQRFVARNLPV